MRFVSVTRLCIDCPRSPSPPPMSVTVRVRIIATQHAALVKCDFGQKNRSSAFRLRPGTQQLSPGTRLHACRERTNERYGAYYNYHYYTDRVCVVVIIVTRFTAKINIAGRDGGIIM